MPSVADLVESRLLRNLTAPDTYAAGVALADRGAVTFDEFGPLRVRARVDDRDVFVADLRAGLGRLAWSCSEPGGSRGALCQHCVAVAVETWRRAPMRASGAGMPEDEEEDGPRARVELAPAEPAAPPSAATDPTAFALPVETRVPVTPDLAATPQAESMSSDVSVGAPLARGEQPDQPASPVLLRSAEQEPAPPPSAEPAPPPTRAPDAPPTADAGGISGIHAVLFTPAVAEIRAFFRDVPGLPHVDAGEGWLIFALPPAELTAHPEEVPSHELYVMCDDLGVTLASLELKGVEVRRPVREEVWGFVTTIVLPGDTELAIYEPKHRSPLAEPRARQS
jgi:hypothetical protein